MRFSGGFLTGAMLAAGLAVAPLSAWANGYGDDRGYGSYKDAPAAPAGRTIWEGFHVGGHAGWVDTDYGINQISPASPLVTVDDNPDGFIGGIVYGTSWQFDRWVLGTDSHFSWSDSDTGANTAANGLSASAEVEWSSSSRVRAGYLMKPNLLVYGTLGVAFADVDVSGGLIAGGGDDERLTGFQYGGGVEAALSNRWFARAEYLHTDYGDENFRETGGGLLNVDLETDVVRGAVGYRFDWSPLDLLR